MSSPMASMTSTTPPTDNNVRQHVAPEECITCRIIGTGALAGVGFYALQMSRPKAPGSVVGKRIMGGIGVCESQIKTRNFPPLTGDTRFPFCQCAQVEQMAAVIYPSISFKPSRPPHSLLKLCNNNPRIHTSRESWLLWTLTCLPLTMAAARRSPMISG